MPLNVIIRRMSGSKFGRNSLPAALHVSGGFTAASFRRLEGQQIRCRMGVPILATAVKAVPGQFDKIHLISLVLFRNHKRTYQQQRKDHDSRYRHSGDRYPDDLSRSVYVLPGIHPILTLD
jgi:hypothetical protein